MVKLVRLTLLLLSVLLNLSIIAEHKTILFNDDWLYWENNATDVNDAIANNQWQAISLPHTWNAHDTVDSAPGYRRSASWYKKILTSEHVNTDGLTQIYFEGSNYETLVYLNGRLVGEHIGGYLGFTFDLTPFLKDDAENELLVRVSNRYNPNLIPSQKSDFFLYGGITRDTWIKHVPVTHITQALISTPSVSRTEATTTVEVHVEAASAANGSIAVQISGPENGIVLSTEQAVSIKQGKNTYRLALDKLMNPELWSPDSPMLYTANIELDINDQSVQTNTQRFGYRWFEMKPHKGFFLNGERLLIRGTHRHEEHAGVGAAMSNEMHRRDMQMIKDLGANFVRLGHYPQDPEIYRAADELGLLIWDEIPWCRGGKGGTEWERNTEYALRTMINQNYNHPSIVFWSLGNEMYWEEDFPGGGRTEIINPYLTKLHNIAKEMDPKRLTTIRKYYPGADIVDAFSPSIWAGWYGGAYNQYEDALKNAMSQYPAESPLSSIFHFRYLVVLQVQDESRFSVLGIGRRADQF